LTRSLRLLLLPALLLISVSSLAQDEEGFSGRVAAGYLATSGNSENLLAGFAEAKRMGLLTIGLAGGDGGRMRADAGLDHCLVVESPSIHRIQECHVAIYHILWDLVHTLLAANPRAAT